MITSWMQAKATNRVSEELLDENIEITFKRGQNNYDDATKQPLDANLLDAAYIDFEVLSRNSRLLQLSTDRHKIVLFQTYFHLGEIFRIKSMIVPSSKAYYEAIKINPNHSDTWYRLGDLLWTHKNDATLASNCFRKCLDTSIVGINKNAVNKLIEIYFTTCCFDMTLKLIELLMPSQDASVYLLKSYILSMNKATQDESDHCLYQSRKLSNQNLAYKDHPLIQRFLSELKPPKIYFSPETSEYVPQIIKGQDPNSEPIIITIQKVNIRGLEKFIKDLAQNVVKLASFVTDELLSTDSGLLKAKKQIVEVLRKHQIEIEFTKVSQGEDVADLVTAGVEKVYQAECEKEVKEGHGDSKGGKDDKIRPRGVSKRMGKRKRNQGKYEQIGEALGYESQLEMNKKVFSENMRKYLDRIKKSVITSRISGILKDKDIEEIYLCKNYQALAPKTEFIDENNQEPEENKREDEKEESKERKRGRKRKNKAKKCKITDKFDIGGEEELNQSLELFFQFLSTHNTHMNMYDFCLLLIEYVLSNEKNCQYLIYTPNSVNFLNIFQIVYITLDNWVDTISLESLLFLAETM